MTVQIPFSQLFSIEIYFRDRCVQAKVVGVRMMFSNILNLKFDEDVNKQSLRWTEKLSLEIGSR